MIITATAMPAIIHQLKPAGADGTGVVVAVAVGVVAGAGVVVGVGVGAGVTVGAGVGVGVGVSVGAGVVVGVGVGVAVGVGAGAGWEGLNKVNAVKWLTMALMVWVDVFTVMPSRTTHAPLAVS